MNGVDANVVLGAFPADADGVSGFHTLLAFGERAVRRSAALTAGDFHRLKSAGQVRKFCSPFRRRAKMV
jgi:hypothetical protein